ncbi:MAG: Fe3+-hydroxamate ABC transporter permease FhuB [Rhizobiales bacterium 62-17]|nr:Fe(3+)-hydroxamate ABC transporter permease FhuB [Hyphomicrobiales bacterium]OJY03383.1 MAG: Fe3+-hydroxamate ABC transporter permease FhuB [Rhizobiales bacterium 62-17]
MVAAETARPRRASLIKVHPSLLVAAFLVGALLLAWRHLSAQLPPAVWLTALLDPDIDVPRQMLAHYSVFPRIAVALLAGAALGLAGTVCQQVLRNPLAEPTTLGVSAGANLTLAAATLWAPTLLGPGREWVAMFGGFSAALCVFALAWSRALAPLALILAGLIVSLYCGAVAGALVIFNHDYLIGLFIWGAGFLNQQDWNAATFLAPRLAIACALIVLMTRPLTLLGFDDETARNLGLGLTSARLASLIVAIALAASVVSAVGVLSFVGLAAPTLVRLAGARRFRDRLLWAPLCGAALLWFTDQIVLTLPSGYREVPTGVATALLGAPILLLLLRRLGSSTPIGTRTDSLVPRRNRHPRQLLIAGLILLVMIVWLALAFGNGPQGWHWSRFDDIVDLAPWRWPRLAAALVAGAMLAVAGVLMQRMTGNPMAAPEVLGISSGAAMGVIILAFSVQAPGRLLQIGAGAAGAFAVLALILLLGRRSQFNPDRFLLAGIATSAIFGAVIAVAMATGDPRMSALLTWLAGSTYRVDGNEALLLCAVAAVLLAATPFLARPLEILPLGPESARAVGLAVASSRFALMLHAALLTAAATLIVGPLSFVGLLAPHMARLLGLQRPLQHLAFAGLIGALLMTSADWLGRMAIFPYQIPAGLLATLLGGPFLLTLIGRRR